MLLTTELTNISKTSWAASLKADECFCWTLDCQGEPNEVTSKLNVLTRASTYCAAVPIPLSSSYLGGGNLSSFIPPIHFELYFPMLFFHSRVSAPLHSGKLKRSSTGARRLGALPFWEAGLITVIFSWCDDTLTTASWQLLFSGATWCADADDDNADRIH